MKNKILHTITITLACLILGILIALQMKTVNQSKLTQRSLDKLNNQVIELLNKNEQLNLQILDQQNTLALLRQQQLDSQSVDRVLLEQINQAEAFAGLTDVTNTGLICDFTNVNQTRQGAQILLLLVNEVRSIGVQALSLGNADTQERLVATSEIRANGDDILINGRAYLANQPFQLRMILDSDKQNYSKTQLESMVTQLKVSNSSLTMTIRSEANVFIPKLNQSSSAFRVDLLLPAARNP